MAGVRWHEMVSKPKSPHEPVEGASMMIVLFSVLAHTTCLEFRQCLVAKLIKCHNVVLESSKKDGIK